MRKNTASQIIGAQMVTATDGTAFTGSVTVAVTGDGGTQATGSVGSGACTHEGNGFHTYAPAQAETNYDHVAFTFTGTGAVPVTVQIYTTFPQTGDAFARLGAPAGASVSADVAAVKTETASILEDTGTTLPATLATIDGIADDLKSGIIYGAAATGTLSTTVATTNLTGYADDQLIGRVVIWLSGACEGEATDITDYASTGGTLTFTALTTAPANGDLFKIV